MANTQPTVSVIVPSFNVEQFLDQALHSIEEQTLHDIEIICVNDGSTDRTLSILEEHAARDGRITVIDKPNGGYGSACNRGMREAHGEWLAIVEPDDWIEPTMYADMVGFARSLGTTVDLVKTPYWRVVNPDTPRERMLHCSYRGRIRPKAQPFSLDADTMHLIIHHPSIWSALYRRGFLEERSICFHEIPGAGWADNPFLIETMCQARAIAYLDRPYYHYREETPEHFHATLRRDPLLPIDRWNDMMDVLDRIGAGDDVRAALVRRAFTYLDSIGEAVDLYRPDIQERIRRMFERMDEKAVLSESHVPPHWKTEFSRVRHLPAARYPKLPYAVHLAETGICSLKNTGLSFTMQSLGGFVGRGEHDPRGDEMPRGDLPDPLFSVVVPVYNAQSYLNGCLDSLAAQTFNSFETVCVDDGSTDSSPKLLEARADDDARIRIISKDNGGPSSARNCGMRAARGEYVIFLDADDELEPDALHRLATVVSRGGIDAVVFGWSCFDGHADHWLASRGEVADAWYPTFEPGLLFEEHTQPFLRIAARRELIERHGLLFDEKLYLGEDAAFLFSLLPHARGTRLLSDKIYRYRLPHEGSIMHRASRNATEECFQGINTVISVFGRWANDRLLPRYGRELIEWSVKYSLYTVLRQDDPARTQLANLLRDLWIAHWDESEIRAMALPEHAKRLVERLLDGNLNGSGHDLARYRMTEYGIGDLALTVIDRLRR